MCTGSMRQAARGTLCTMCMPRLWGLVSLVLAATTTASAAIYEAKCVIQRDNSVTWQPIEGTIRLRQEDDGPVFIGLRLNGFNTTLAQQTHKHGFHIHENNDTSERCTKVGGHFNPTQQDHGAPTDSVRHAGDLGNVVEEDGEVNTVLEDSVITLTDTAGRHNVVGRTMVVHANEDDLGRGGESDSLTTGHAGTKIGCCLIEEAEAKDFLKATCNMVAGSDANEAISGSVDIQQLVKGGMTTYTLDLAGFDTTDEYDMHGFHVHAGESTAEQCKAAGGHYNPLNVTHGGPYNSLKKRHVGDLGNINETTSGTVTSTIYDVGSGLADAYSILQRAIVVHQKADDLGLKDTVASRSSGDAGHRLGCCIITAPAENLQMDGATGLRWTVLPLVVGMIISLVWT